MKTRFWWVLFLPVAALCMVGCSGDGKSGIVKRMVLPADEVHEGWYFASGDQVLILGTVNGDVYAAGGIVQVDGTVNGDLLVAGGSVSINGRIRDDVRAAGGSVDCSGSVGKNFSVAGGSIRLLKTAEVGGGVLAAGGDIRLGGRIENQVVLAAGDAQISGNVLGNVRFVGGGIMTIPGASIRGGLQATVENPERAQIAAGTVDGTVEITTEKRETRGTILGFSVVHFWIKIVWALSLIATAMLMILLSPRSVELAGMAVWQRPWWSLLWGCGGVLVIPLVVAALCATLIGIPVGVFLMALYCWFLFLSQMVLGVVFGQRVFMPERGGKFMLAAIVGIVLVQVLTFVPYLGSLLVLAGVLLGFGGILEVVRQHFRVSEKMSPPLA